MSPARCTWVCASLYRTASCDPRGLSPIPHYSPVLCRMLFTCTYVMLANTSSGTAEGVSSCVWASVSVCEMGVGAEGRLCT